ncbi:MAG: hypothetical protein Q3982_07990 [Phoenicibacter congonensis]|uniref:Uncharacterized protein n=1 Tax=Phoenicibacter congonensis TaxID=1944646 RepID=A0AA43RKQ2_9ACTN|nr:hypothetical protein [Phoenicibacter congonensis]
MNHRTGYKVTIIDTEQFTLTRTVKRKIKIEPLQRRTETKNTTTVPPVIVHVEVRQDAGNHVTQDVN